MRVPFEPEAVWQGDWAGMARAIVHRALRVEPGERVLIHADPTYFPTLLEQVRIEIHRARAVELAAVMLSPPGLAEARRRLGRREDATLREMEDRAMAEVFALADVFIWLPTRWAYNPGQTEEILAAWPGRAVHFHWIMECADPALFRRLSDLYAAALDVDGAALTARQERLIEALRDAAVEVTDPRGTRLRFRLPGAHFHVGNGDASRAFVHAYARSARDREVELPAGAVRTVDVAGVEGVLVTPPETFGGRPVGSLRVEFREDRIVSIRSERHARWVTAAWETESGDRDRFGELNVGVNPLLRPRPDLPDVVPYYGYGAGVVRVSLGDNSESGGGWRSTYHQWLFLTDATVRADGRTLVEGGELVLA
jgi:leucyl aminopeptidase (aminopeptidase T)